MSRLRFSIRPAIAIFMCVTGGMLLDARQAAGPGIERPPVLAIDVVAVDRTGSPVDDLTAADFIVSVDGTRRNVAAIRYVSRGPGALTDTQALSLARGNRSGVEFAAEPARTAVVVLDQTTILQGTEKAAIAAARTVVDRLGLDDNVGIVRLPLTSNQAVTLDNNRPALFATLAGITGLATTRSLDVPDPFAMDPAAPPVVADPDRAGTGERAAAAEAERPATDDAHQAAFPEGDVRRGRGNVADLRALFESLQATPGRKVVAVLSAGLTTADRALIDEAAAAAARANVVVYAFGLRASRLATGAPDAGALESLARATGGQFASLGRNPDQAIAKVFGDLAACYVLNFDGTDPAKRRQAVRVTVSRPGIIVRAPAWLVARRDAEDVRLPALSADRRPSATPPPGAAAAGEPAAVTPVDAPRSEKDVAQALALRRLLARAADYVEAYQREYSSLVAEEEYSQADWTVGAATRSLRTRSDVLLVRVDRVDGWISFRDVFEVDGRPLRERDERLQRLFLDPSVESRGRLAAIQADSSRYNIGPVKRTVNSPLLPLTFLERPNSTRFGFDLGGDKDVDGVQAWAVDYRETSSPTIAMAENGSDQPVRGRFLIDPATGAILESRMVYERPGAGQIEYVIRYRRNEKLGLWLPDEMRETYSRNGRPISQGEARYRNFRRFQVNADITGTSVPK